MTPTALEALLTAAVRRLPPELKVRPGAYGVVTVDGYWRACGKEVCPFGALLLGLPVHCRPPGTPMEQTLSEVLQIAPWKWQSVVAGFDWNGVAFDEYGDVSTDLKLGPWLAVGARLRDRLADE